MSIAIQRLTVNGNSGGIGPNARLVEKSEPEHAQLPCSEARTVLATKLRRTRAQVKKVSSLILGQIQNEFIILHYYLYQFERLPTAHCLNRIKLQPQLLTGQGGVSGLNAQHLADLGPKSGLEHAADQLLGEMSSALESRLSSKIVYRLSVQVSLSIQHLCF